MPSPFDPTAAMTSFLDPGGYQRQQQLWDTLGGIAKGLIAAGAPSPYPTNAGQAFGSAVAGGLQGMNTGQDAYLKRQMAGIQGALAMQKLKQYQDWTKLMTGGGGAAPATPDATAAVQPPTPPTTDNGGTIPQPGYAAATTPGAVQTGQDESGGNYNAVNPVSGAGGKYQFMPETWATVAQAHPDLKLPFDMRMATPQQQEAAKTALDTDNSQGLRTLGITPDAAGLYLAQRFGVKGASTFMGAPDNTALSAIFPASWIQQNPDLQGKTVGQFKQAIAGRYGVPTMVAQGAQPGAAAPPNANGQGDSVAPAPTPVQYTPPAGKTLAQVVQSIPPGVRQMIGVLGPQQGLPLLMKYADPETVPAIDNQTGQVVFAPKTQLNSGRYTPVDAQKLANDTRRLQMEEQNYKGQAANRDIVLGPDGKPQVNQPLLDFKKGVSAAQGTDVEGKMRLGDYEDVRKFNSGMQSTALQARTGIAQVNRLSQLLDQVATGRFTSSTQEIKQMAKGIGIDLGALGITDDTAPAQAADALSKQLALSLRNPSQGAGMPGSLSNSDRDFLAKMVPGLETTPEGRKLMIQYAVKMYQRQIDLAKITNDYMRSPEAKKDPNGLYTKLQEYADAHPLFDQKDLPAGGMTPANNLPPPPAGFRIPGQTGQASPSTPAPPAGFRVVQ